MTDKAAVEVPSPVSGRVVVAHRRGRATWCALAPS